MKKILVFFILLISTGSFAVEYKSNFSIEEFKYWLLFGASSAKFVP
jgi:hypothetical protein